MLHSISLQGDARWCGAQDAGGVVNYRRCGILMNLKIDTSWARPLSETARFRCLMCANGLIGAGSGVHADFSQFTSMWKTALMQGQPSVNTRGNA